MIALLTFYKGQVSIAQHRELRVGYSARSTLQPLPSHSATNSRRRDAPAASTEPHKLPPLALLSPGLFPPPLSQQQQMLRKPALYAQSEVATITSQHICSFPPLKEKKKKQPLTGVCGFGGVLQSVVTHTNLDPQRCRV